MIADIDAELAACERITEIARIELLRCEVEIEFAFGIKPQYTVEWSTKGRVAGWCFYPHGDRQHNLLKFNAYLAVQEGERFKETIAHEYCHAVAGHIAGHGPRWRQFMLVLGYAGHRCHRYTTQSAAQQRKRGLV